MNIADARKLFDYTEWANERMAAACSGLTGEQLDREIVSSFPSIRLTLAHMASAEWIWLRRWLGESPSVWPEWIGEAPLDQVVAGWREVARERSAWLDGLADADLERAISYRSMKGDPFTNPLRDLFTHVANHATYHRGQLTTMLRQVGATPPATDFSVYIRR
jgi:uncharacterized damage-inducible protein DinB